MGQMKMHIQMINENGASINKANYFIMTTSYIHVQICDIEYCDQCFKSC